MRFDHFRSLFVGGTACAVLSSTLVAQQGGALQAGREYRAGELVRSPWTGVSFTVPASLIGAYDGEVGAFLLGDAAEPTVMLGVFAYSEGTTDEVASLVLTALTERGYNLSPRGEPDLSEHEASGWYDVTSDEGRGLLYGFVRRGAPGNVVAVAALGAPDKEAKLKQLTDAVAQSVQFAVPQAAQWRQLAQGKTYSTTSSGSDFSPGGGGAASGASSSRTQLDLCSDGSYAYQSSSETYISVEGAGSMSSSSSDEHVGRWWLVADVIGSAWLVLEATDGREFHWSVVEQDDGVLIDGQRYGVGPGQRCY
jgi:hypothetical protein